MAYPVIKVDSTNGAASDSAASGAGPTTAITGAAGVTASDGSANVGCRVNLDGSPDLTNVLTDGSHTIYWADSTAGARNHAAIVAKGNSGGPTAFVDVNSAQFLGGVSATNGTTKAWAIGGVRATVCGTVSKKLFDNNSAAGDAMPGWAVECQSGHVETGIAAALAMRRSGTQVDGRVTLRAAAAAATKPILAFNLNGGAITHSGSFCETSGILFKCTAATRTASVGIATNTGSLISGNQFGTSSSDSFNKAITSAVGAGMTIIGNNIGWCLADGISPTAGGRFEGNFIHDCVGNGVAITGANAGGIYEENIIVRCLNGISDARTGTTANGGLHIKKNTIANNVNDGIVITANGTTVTTPFLGMMLKNNNLTGNGTGGTGRGLNLSGAPVQQALDGGSCVIIGNNFGSGTTANATAACSLASAIADPTNIAVDPAYVNAAGDNFTVTASGAKGAGAPTVNIGGGGSATRSYNTAGAADPNPAATYTAAANVRLGTDRGDGTTGTLAVPATNKVLSGESVDATTGTLTLPTAAQVLVGVAFGIGGTGSTGTVTLPAASAVLIGTTYGASLGTTGTVTLPAVSTVLIGTTFGASLGSTGTVTLPVVGDVRSGTTYGASLGLTGTLVVSGGGTYTDPGIANVKTGIGYTFNSSSLTGTYDGSDRWTDPGITHVQSGTAYKANSTTNNRTGTYDPVTGNYTDPGVGNVALSVTYQFAGATLTGTLSGGGGGGATLAEIQSELNARGLTSAFTTNRSGYILASDGLDSVVVETGVNARQALSLIGAATAGKASGLQTSTATFYAMGLAGTTTPRIVATTSAGNRTATTLSPP